MYPFQFNIIPTADVTSQLTQRSRLETFSKQIPFYRFLLVLVESGRGGPRTVWPPETFFLFQEHNFSLLTAKFQDIVFLIIDSHFTSLTLALNPFSDIYLHLKLYVQETTYLTLC